MRVFSYDLISRVNKLRLSPNEAALDGPTATDPTAPEGLVFHYADNARPLATPWQVAIERAKMVRKCKLPKGPILDPACGSGIQLAAYCSILNKRGIGIELDELTGRAANANLKRIYDHGFGKSLIDSEIIIGDGTKNRGDTMYSMLHLDPARPRNSRTHSLDEMAPKLQEIFAAWKGCLISGEKGPGILLDLSPRLQTSQRKEVESIVEDFWPNIGKTWVWTSRGRGRVDRLSLWLGQLSSQGVSRRFVRIPPEPKNKPLVVEGDYEEISEHRRPPRRGEYVSILDAALVESGLANNYLEKVLPDTDITWSITSGRRPQIHHDGELKYQEKNQKLLIQATGRIVKLAHVDLSLETISSLVGVARDYGFGKLTLRMSVDPGLQPRLQGSLDRQLNSKGGQHKGFVTKQPHDSMLLLCQESQ